MGHEQSKQKEQNGQRPWGRKELGVSEELKRSHYGGETVHLDQALLVRDPELSGPSGLGGHQSS